MSVDEDITQFLAPVSECRIVKYAVRLSGTVPIHSTLYIVKLYHITTLYIINMQEQDTGSQGESGEMGNYVPMSRFRPRTHRHGHQTLTIL